MMLGIAVLFVTVGAKSIMEIIKADEIKKLFLERRTNRSSEVEQIRSEKFNKLNNVKEEAFKWLEMLKSAPEGQVMLEARDLRRPWCRSRTIELRIAPPGCTPRRILTRICFGQCNSFFVPREEGLFESCPACRPARGSWISPPLHCSGRQNLRARIFRVKRCKCLPVK